MPLDWSAERRPATWSKASRCIKHSLLAHIGLPVRSTCVVDGQGPATSDFLIENVPVRARGAAEPLPPRLIRSSTSLTTPSPKRTNCSGRGADDSQCDGCSRSRCAPCLQPASIDIDIRSNVPTGCHRHDRGSDAHVETSAQLVDSKSLRQSSGNSRRQVCGFTPGVRQRAFGAQQRAG